MPVSDGRVKSRLRQKPAIPAASWACSPARLTVRQETGGAT